MLGLKWIGAFLASTAIFCAEIHANENHPCNGEIPPEGQLFEYCEAAKASGRSRKSQKLLEGIWWAATGICAGSCIAEQTGYGTTAALIACAASQDGATGIEGYQAIKRDRDFAKALGQAGITLAGNLLGNVIVSKLNLGISSSCIGAALSAARAIYKGQSAKKHRTNREENLRLAALLDSKAPPSLGFDRPSREGQLGENAIQGGGDSTAGASFSISPQNPTCVDSIQTQNTAGVLACAAAVSGGTLPIDLRGPKFARAFRKETGKDLGKFLKDAASGKGSRSNPFLSKLSPKTQKTLKELGQKYAKELGLSDRTHTYASSASSRSNPGARARDLKFGSLFKNSGNSKRTPSQNGAYGRSYTDVFNDRSLSLFSRIATRYQKIGTRLKKLPWFSRYNRKNR